MKMVQILANVEANIADTVNLPILGQIDEVVRCNRHAVGVELDLEGTHSRLNSGEFVRHIC